MKLVECVPNFSEGRDISKINTIADAIKSIAGVRLLDVDPGPDTNRTVMTFIGEPETVKQAAFAAIKKAAEVIDMSKHKGEHARMGATDVCPFIPITGVTMEECVALAHELGKQVAEELDIPVYMYEYAARRSDRKNLADIRVGEYEALPEKMKDSNFAPDYGRASFNAKSGATVIGAREFLIAYNVNLNTTDEKLAKKIANQIREKGTFARDEKGEFIRDENGEKVRTPGIFSDCKATGWYIEQYKQAQVTINLTNYTVTPPHLVFDEICKLADEMGLRVTGSELVGLIPKEAMMMAGRHYLKKQGKCEGVPEDVVIRTAVISMGLEDIAPFDPSKKIIEYCVSRQDALAGLNVKEFIYELSSDSPAPGGGSVSALCGALSAALSAMVANLTFGKKGYEKTYPEMNSIAQKGQELLEKFVAAIDADTDAFNEVMRAIKLKSKTDEEKAAKCQAVEDATKKATLVPLSILELTLDSLAIAESAAIKGNHNSVSDAGVAAVCALAAAKGGWYNVMINLLGIEDQTFKRNTADRANRALKMVKAQAEKVEGIVEKSLLQVSSTCS